MVETVDGMDEETSYDDGYYDVNEFYIYPSYNLCTRICVET